MKQIYKLTYPTGKIYVGKDSYGSFRYFGNPDIETVNADFATLPKEVQMDYSVRKEILWESETASESELSQKEIEFIREYRSSSICLAEKMSRTAGRPTGFCSSGPIAAWSPDASEDLP